MAFKVGDAVKFNYRSAHGVEGTIAGVVKRGRTDATTMYAVRPLQKYIHPGEQVPVHRSGASLSHRST